MNMRTLFTAGLLLMATMALSACSIDITRNEDGSLRVEGVMDEHELESELALAIKDPLVQNLDVDVRNSAVFASGQRRHPDNSGVDTLAFRLDLGVRDGSLTASISGATVNGEPIEAWRVRGWNERLASRLERAAGRRPNSALQNVSLEDDAITMVWRIETPRSRG
jgi:hypothetical protein